MDTKTKRIIGAALVTGAIGVSGLGVAASQWEVAVPPPVATPPDRCAEAVQTWPMGDKPHPEGCGCDHEALAAAIAAQQPIELVGFDGERTTVQPEDFTSPAMVEACPDLPHMREAEFQRQQ